MVFVVVVKKLDNSVAPEFIIDALKYNKIPLDENIKYYEKRKINNEKKTYNLNIKYRSFEDDNNEMKEFYKNLINYKWIKIFYKDFSFKISIKTIDFYNFVYNNNY